MSAFRVKTTSKFLPNAPAEKTEKKDSSLFFLDIDEKSSFLDKISSNKKSSSAPMEGPKVGNNVGMSIRKINTAQADHM